MAAGIWAYGLLHAIKDEKEWVISSDKIVVIKDKFPKAKFHYLVIPKENIPTIFELTQDHLDLLQEMHLMAVNVIELNNQNIDDFKIGFHAEPSMQRLHLHVISTDFDSTFLKTKKHWNSFNTIFFIIHQSLVDQLKEAGNIPKTNPTEAKELLATPLQCNKCNYKPKNMPSLKDHLRTHRSQHTEMQNPQTYL